MKKLKSELWDKVQYIFRNYYDRMTHAAFFYDGRLDINVVRRAVKRVVDSADVLHSSYHPGVLRHYWRVNEDYELHEMATIFPADTVETGAETCLTTTIPYDDKLQFRVFVVRAPQAGDALCFVTNHMCFDGADLKYYCAKVIECYNAIVRTGSADDLPIKSGSRDAAQVYAQMPPEKRKQAKNLYKNVSRTGLKQRYPFTEEREERSRILRVPLCAETAQAAADKAKREGATFNDLFIAAFLRALARATGLGADEKIGVTSMVNLRRHRADKATDGMTNLTGFMPTVIEGVGETLEETLRRVAERNGVSRQDECLGLYGLPLLRLAFRIFPYFAAEWAIRIGYENPLFGMSNIGRLDEADYAVDGLTLADAFMTGAVKYKPYLQLTATEYRGRVTLCIAQRCGARDAERLRALLKDVAHAIEQYAQC